MKEIYTDVETRFFTALRKVDMVTAHHYLEEAVKDDSAFGVAIYKYMYALILARDQQDEEALAVFNEALRFFEETSDESRISITENGRGQAYQGLGDLETAQRCFSRAIDYAHRSGNTSIRGAATSNLGFIHLVNGEIHKAIDHFARAIDLHREAEHRLNESNSLMNLGMCYYMVGDAETSLSCTRQAIAIREEIGDEEGLPSIYGNLAYSLYMQGEVEEASVHNQKAFDMSKGFSAMRKSDIVLNQMLIRTSLGDHAEAREIYNEHKSIMAGEDSWEAYISMFLGILNRNEGNHIEAKAFLEKSLITMRPNLDTDSLIRTRELLCQIAKEDGDFDAYIVHNDARAKLVEEIRGAETTRKVAHMQHQRDLAVERKESEKQKAVLYSTLPKHVADRMVRGEDVTDHFDHSSVLFLDIVGFTTLSDMVPPGHVVHLLKAIFKVCDNACREYGLTKIKTIGDSYLAASGVPEPLADHADRAAQAALKMMSDIDTMELTMDPALGDTSWTKEIPEISVRIGLHSGPVVAGVVGDQQLQYDIWGDTVNTASRMESSGEAKRIQASDAFVKAIQTDSVAIQKRGTVEVKGKGSMETYWLSDNS